MNPPRPAPAPAAHGRPLPGPVPLPAPPTPGSARLHVGCHQGTSFVASLQSTSPLRLLAPVSRGPSVWAYASSFGGGMLAGDETQLDLRLDPGARGFVGTQSATKVYRNPLDLPCGHRTRATLAPHALLAFLPEPVQPFAESSYHQHQEFRLADSAGLVLLDAVTAGRPARDERWAFARYESRTRVVVADQTRFLDVLALRPDDGPLPAPHRLGRFDALAVLLVLGPPLRELAARLLATVAARPITRRAPLVATAGPLADGALVRIAGERTEDVLAEVRRLLDPLPSLLGDDPWSRHW